MKRMGIYLGCLLFSLLVLWSIVFGVDCYCTMQLQRPMFALANITADDGGSGTYRGLGYTVDIAGELSAEYGFVVHKAELTLLGRVVAGAVE